MRESPTLRKKFDTIGDVSAAHINPAVTLAFWLGRRFTGRDVVPFIVSQFVGAYTCQWAAASDVLGTSKPWCHTAGRAVGAVIHSRNRADLSADVRHSQCLHGSKGKRNHGGRSDWQCRGSGGNVRGSNMRSIHESCPFDWPGIGERPAISCVALRRGSGYRRVPGSAGVSLRSAGRLLPV